MNFIFDSLTLHWFDHWISSLKFNYNKWTLFLIHWWFIQLFIELYFWNSITINEFIFDSLRVHRIDHWISFLKFNSNKWTLILIHWWFIELFIELYFWNSITINELYFWFIDGSLNWSLNFIFEIQLHQMTFIFDSLMVHWIVHWTSFVKFNYNKWTLFLIHWWFIELIIEFHLWNSITMNKLYFWFIDGSEDCSLNFIFETQLQ